MPVGMDLMRTSLPQIRVIRIWDGAAEEWDSDGSEEEVFSLEYNLLTTADVEVGGGASEFEESAFAVEVALIVLGRASEFGASAFAGAEDLKTTGGTWEPGG